MKRVLSLVLFVMLLCAANAVAQSACTTPPTGTHSITLTWTQTGNYTGFNVFCSLVKGGPYTKLGSTTGALTYVQGSLGQNYTSFFVVTAVNGNQESGYSNEAQATTPFDKPVPPVLGAPIVAMNPPSVHLDWAWTGQGQATFSVFRKGPNQSLFVQRAANLKVFDWTDSKVVKGKTYFYATTAKVKKVNSDFSNTVQATVQ